MKKIFLFVLVFSSIVFSQVDSTLEMGYNGNFLPENYISTTEWGWLKPSSEYPERICTLVTLENGDVDTLFFDERKHLDELNKEEMKIIIRQFIKLLTER